MRQINKYILWRWATVIADGRQDARQNGDEKRQPS